MKNSASWAISVALLCGSLLSTCWAQCPISYGGADDAKPNKLYVYFPTADDNTYPEFGVGTLTTSPAHRFDAAELTNYTGTTADLRNAVFTVVRDDYCEFNVQVIQTTTAPPSTFGRRNTVAAGTDTDPTASGTFGLAQAVDTGDPTAVDFARVWAGTYQTEYGGAGGALNGTNSTLERWARSIGGTVAHEGGHNYGLSHFDGTLLATGEDPLVHHLMASGSHYSGEDRASYRRHFSDHEYSIIASNVGLSIQTMWNWDLVNPNAETATRLRMTFLSTKPSLILSWWYGGNLSPWINPTVTGPSGTTTFKGTTYNTYQIEWSTGQAWSGGASGQVGGGARFHVGATFSSVDFTAPEAIIITDATLFDSSGTALAQHPRMLGYDAGTLDSATGTLDMRFFNFSRRRLIVRDVIVRDLPRVMSLDAMVPGGRMVDVRRAPLRPWPSSTRTRLTRSTIEAAEKPFTAESKALAAREVRVRLGQMSQKRHVFRGPRVEGCETIDRLRGPDVARCGQGFEVDLFPATSVFLTATVVDPAAKYWDPKRKRYVVGPLASKLFYQIAGRHPDLNRNGTDDFVDIRSGKFRDRGDGVPVPKR